MVVTQGDRPSSGELAALGLYDASAPDAADRLRLLLDALDLGATLEEVTRAAGVRQNLGPLMIDLAMRPAGATKDLSDFLATEPDAELLRRMWSALGLPDSTSPVVRVTPDAADALRLLAGMVALFGEEAALGVARVMGSTMARLAETMSGAFRVGAEVPRLNTGAAYAEVAESYAGIVREQLPSFLEALGAVFRRHLVNASYQTWSTDTEQAAVTMERTICFADLVGSTELLSSVSVREMAALLRRFEEQVWDLVSASGGRVVKLIGDEAMIVFADPAQACRVGLDLIAVSEFPVRIGMAQGTVVSLYGDYYGPTVNLAARLVKEADPSTVLVSEGVRFGGGPGLVFEARDPIPLKGFAGAVHVFEVR